MSDMSFKQAKELVEKIELTEVTLNKTVNDIQEASKSFNDSLRQQKLLLEVVPSMSSKLDILRLLVAVNFGFLLGLIVGKYIL